MVTPEITPANTAAARACALAVVRRVFEEDAWADRALRTAAERLGLEGTIVRRRDEGSDALGDRF